MVYSGRGPNHTISYVMDQSGIINMYRSCQESIDKSYGITKQTGKHSEPKTKILLKLMRESMLKGKVNIKTPSQGPRGGVRDNVLAGEAWF